VIAYSALCIIMLSRSNNRRRDCLLQTLWVAESCEDKRSVEKRCVDVLFNLSECCDVESIEDHLYIRPTASTAPAAATNVSAVGLKFND